MKMLSSLSSSGSVTVFLSDRLFKREHPQKERHLYRLKTRLNLPKCPSLGAFFRDRHAVGEEASQIRPGHVAPGLAKDGGNQGDAFVLIGADIAKAGRGGVAALDAGGMGNIEF